MKNLVKKVCKTLYNLVFLLFPPILRRVSMLYAIKTLFPQKVLGFNRSAYWPVHFTSKVTGANNIIIGEESAPGWSPGCYIQGIGQIEIGDLVRIAPNVGIISANHSLEDINKHVLSKVKIGSYSWIGMNAVILPGVELGEHTIVGAGSIVTKSFQEGYCVIAGNPARKIKDINPSSCVHKTERLGYRGYLSEKQFFRRLKNEKK